MHVEVLQDDNNQNRARRVATNCCFRFEKSLIRLKTSSRVSMTRSGRLERASFRLFGFLAMVRFRLGCRTYVASRIGIQSCAEVLAC